MKLVLKLLARLYPAEWRARYGAEYEALLEEGPPRLRDAVDVAWAVVKLRAGCLSPIPAEQQALLRAPLLAGKYAVISQGSLSFFDLARASVLSILLLVLFGYAETAGSRFAVAFRTGTGSQASGDRAMSFNVASVKQNNSGLTEEPTFNVGLGVGNGDSPSGGYFSAVNEDLATYILFAYKMPASQYRTVLDQLPDWAKALRFDIKARAGGNPTKDEMRLMMQTLLADRFKLIAHTGTQQGPVYALVLARPGITGPNLQPHRAAPVCMVPPPAQHGPGVPSTVPGGFPASCGEVVQLPASVPGDVRLSARDVAAGQIASMASEMFTMGQLDRPVLDQTGLAGTFDFNLEFMPAAGAGTPPPPPGGALPDGMGEEFPQALQRQLGLKLVKGSGPVKTFAIEHVERPSEN